MSEHIKVAECECTRWHCMRVCPLLRSIPFLPSSMFRVQRCELFTWSFQFFFLFIPSMHAVIRSLTKNYCVFSFIVHSCKLQCLKCSVDECTYAREEREKKIIHIFVHLVLCFFLSNIGPSFTISWLFFGFKLSQNLKRMRRIFELKQINKSN